MQRAIRAMTTRLAISHASRHRHFSGPISLLHPHRGHTLDRVLAGEHGLGEGHRAAHGCRLRHLGDDDRESGLMQAISDARGQIAAAADEN